MKRRIWFFHTLLIIGCYLVWGANIVHGVQEKEEATVPVPVQTTLSPPEGNTTFLGGTTWCVALPGASQADLQTALDWACGAGSVDCKPIRPNGPCFQPDTLLSHASYAFNSYYQQNGNNDVACFFGGTATLTKRNPSYGKCLYAVSGPASSSPTKLNAHRAITSVLLLFVIYLTRCFLA